MKSPHHFICPFLFFLYTACQNQTGGDDTSSFDYQLVLVDSIKVDYLDNLVLNDFDAETGVFLAFNGSKRELILFDMEGAILEQFTISDDGPDAVTGYALNPRFINGNIGAFTDAVYEVDRKGKLLKKQSLPYDFYHHVVGSTNILFEIDGKYAYPKPENSANPRDFIAYYQKIINGGHIIETLDPRTQETKGTMAFPSNNNFENGFFNGYPIPIIYRNQNTWLMTVPNLFEFYVYKEEESGLSFQNSVEIPVKAPILNKPVPIQEHESYFKANGNLGFIPGVNSFGKMNRHTLINYSNGIPSEVMSQYNVDDGIERDKLLEKIPKLFAVFDHDFNPIMVDKPFPKEILPYGFQFTDKGQLAGIKNQEYLGKEDDFHTIYLYELKK
ncbi:hypothetical protein [Pleomorphovibrio marinus]|uniref:hypothetical protein n=1 Tax=Pleomorphovibrio marinus TaxID=2164132 RepID=UPI000E0B7880|nr:hypothetical protein [Pleomorphovibrio marinus]